MFVEKRPRKLSDMSGQPRTIAEMTRRSKDRDYPTGMIMEGESGSGKTTLGLIIASTLNCHSPVENENGGLDPCGQCPSCVDIQKESFNRDVHFFDGSTMGKDRVLDLEQLASSVPFYDGNKVIIIDEAQELSKQSFGATLRLLEKKRPSGASTYFILCTMDRNAIAKAIKDRCETYKFWPVPSDEIAEKLYGTLKEEVEDFDAIPEEFITKGLFMLSDYAAGSVRAGLAALERCVYGEIYDPQAIQEELGYISPDTLTNIITKLLKGDPTFFSDIKRSQEAINDFYHKSWTALLNSKLYLAGAIDLQPEWRKKNALQFMQFRDTVEKVLSIYEEIFENSKYMKPDYFLSKLWTGVFEVPQLTKLEGSQQNKRVRKKRES